MIPKNSKRNIIFNYAKERFDESAEYLWKNDPYSAVLRNSLSGKWYAVFMCIPADRLGLSGSERVDIMNVKCSELMLGNLLLTDGFFPSYHMNKQRWITMLLDGSVSDSMMLRLLEMSREMVTIDPKKRRRKNA